MQIEIKNRSSNSDSEKENFEKKEDICKNGISDPD